ncbi:MAG: methyltransferase [Acidobacteria bacterium]|nr:methyltransferase [Acidobacteriota bacterium]
MGKTYDRAYFERWYRRPASRLEAPAELRRRVTMAVAIAERYLGRAVRSALDVGCGEGRWRAELRRLRPRLRYVGVEPSDYAVERFGRRRGIVRADFGDLAQLDLGGPFDLVVCADVLHYLDDEELDRGLPALVAATGGAAYLEVLTAAEEVEGDTRGMILRAPEGYEARFARAGLTGVGGHVWLAPALTELPAALERRTS